MSPNDNLAPIPNSYWAIPGRFLAGEYPGGLTDIEARKKLGPMLDAGVDTSST